MISDLFTHLYRPVGRDRIAWFSGGCQSEAACWGHQSGLASGGRHRAKAEHPVRVWHGPSGAGPSPDMSLRAIPRGPRDGVAISSMVRLPRRASLRSALLATTRGEVARLAVQGGVMPVPQRPPSDPGP